MEIIEIAEELEELNRTGTRVPGFRRKVLVDIDRLADVADELKSSVPDNMREADEVLTQKESIINQATWSRSGSGAPPKRRPPRRSPPPSRSTRPGWGTRRS